jgi:di-N-acetylchitobiase
MFFLLLSVSSFQQRATLRTASERFALAASSAPSYSCPCSDPSLCKPIGGLPLKDKEVFGFVGGNGSTLDFSRITTIAWGSNTTLMCLAHAHGVRVTLGAPAPEKVLLANASVRAQWVQSAVQSVVNSHHDGLVFDWESPARMGSPEQKAYVELIGATRDALHKANPSYQVSTCVAWSPDDIDGRDYDVVGFAKNSDVLYVMDYDTRSQIFDACIAAANAPFPGMAKGLQRYRDLGVDPSQLILGVPWYGYRYPCLPNTDQAARFCPIKSVPFRGVNCSDAAGSEVGYQDIMQRFAKGSSPTGRLWDANQGASFFNLVENQTVVQYWYDDPQSLAPKYAYAKGLGLRGVGPFTFTDVAKGDHAMWAALDAFLK